MGSSLVFLSKTLYPHYWFLPGKKRSTCKTSTCLLMGKVVNHAFNFGSNKGVIDALKWSTWGTRMKTFPILKGSANWNSNGEVHQDEDRLY